MAYLALARKWRPKTFSEVVGQKHVVQALSNALDSGRLHHAFMFSGTRGVGKTTLARIFAKSLNCEQGVSAEPCQQCSTCIAIDEGRFVDLIEVDAASRTKVDDTRELLENVHYAPTSGKYKVYLIDEVHMLSGHSFNALLKTLEEPPEHVKFLFATTDPQKLPVTVLSRCLQFNLRAMRPEQVENQLVKILGQEEIDFDQSALHAIAKAADGSMRDGLSLLDQAIAQGGGEVRAADVESMLGTIKAEHSTALLKAIAAHNADQIMIVVADMADHAVDFGTALDELLIQLYHVSLAQVAATAFSVKESARDMDVALIAKVAESIDAQTIQLYYQIGLLGKRDIALAPSLRVGFEMTLLRMLAFEPVDHDSDSGAKRQKPNLQSPTPIKELQATTAAETETAPSSATAPTQRPEATPIPAGAQPANLVAVDVLQVVEEHTPMPTTPTAIAVTLAGNNEWGELIEQSGLVGLSKELAMNCACEKLSDDKVMLTLSSRSEHLFKADRVQEIQTQIQMICKSTAIIELEVSESDKETPSECLQRLSAEQLEQTKQNLHNDPGVQSLMSEFGATINEQSIKPV